MRTVAVVQARTGSSRFPAKALADLNGEPVIVHLLRRVGRAKIDEVWLGTTMAPEDDALVRVAAPHVTGVHRWPIGQANILRGFVTLGITHNADVIIRITADCPLLDPATVDMVVARIRMGDCEHVEVTGMPDGTWCEAVRLETLLRILDSDPDDDEREHVTLHARRRPTEFDLALVDSGAGLGDARWCVDTPDDLEVVRRLVAGLGTAYTFGDLVQRWRAHPEWRALNADVPTTAVERELLESRVLQSVGR